MPLLQQSLACIFTLAVLLVGLRSWLKLDKSGRPEHVLANKHRLTDELGLQSRDLRLLDPAKSTSYPSAILCRDRALLVNLEQIRCIITTQYVLVLDANKVGHLAGSWRLHMHLTQVIPAHVPT